MTHARHQEIYAAWSCITQAGSPWSDHWRTIARARSAEVEHVIKRPVTAAEALKVVAWMRAAVRRPELGGSWESWEDDLKRWEGEVLIKRREEAEKTCREAEGAAAR